MVKIGYFVFVYSVRVLVLLVMKRTSLSMFSLYTKIFLVTKAICLVSTVSECDYCRSLLQKLKRFGLDR